MTSSSCVFITSRQRQTLILTEIFFCQNYFSGIEKRRMQDDAGERVDVSLFKHTSLRNSLRLSSWLEMKFTLKYKTLDRLLSCVE